MNAQGAHPATAQHRHFRFAGVVDNPGLRAFATMWFLSKVAY
jgi:hypothetical protein